MITITELKEYFWYIFGVIGVVFFWAGVWDGVGYLPYLENPWISLAVGLTLLTLSGLIFKGRNPFWGGGQTIAPVLHSVHAHPRRHEFHIKYRDNLQKRELLLRADKIKRIEKGFLITLERGRESFIPFHRVTEVLHNGKTHWKQ